MIKQVYRLIVWENGLKYYFYKNQFHKLNGPALMWPNGDQLYYVNDKRHRLDGPALIFYKDDSLENEMIVESYFVNNKYILKEAFYQKYYQEND